MDAYIYQGTLLCEACGENAQIEWRIANGMQKTTPRDSEEFNHRALHDICTPAMGKA